METRMTISRILIFVLLLLFTSPITSHPHSLKSEQNYYLMLSIDGTITLLNDSTPLWHSTLSRPLIETKINVKTLNFNEENILPGEDAKLYLINSQKEQFTLLNYTISEMVNNKKLIETFSTKDKFFIGKKIKTYFIYDLQSGKDIFSTNNSNSSQFLFFTRNDYVLYYMHNDSVLFWNATQSTFDISTNIKNGENEEITDKDKAIYESNKNKCYYFYKLNKSNGNFVLLSDSSSNMFNYDINTYQLNQSSFSFRFYLTVLIFILSVVTTSSILYSISNKTQSQTDTKSELLPKVSSSPILSYKKTDSSNSSDISNISTISLMNKSFDDYPIKQNRTFNRSIGCFAAHKNSAPEIERKHINTNKSKNSYEDDYYDYYDEQLASNKEYKMNPIDSTSPKKEQCATSIRTYLSSSRKQSESVFINKKKFKASEAELHLLKELSERYLNDKSKSSSDSLYKFHQCANISDKYYEIYKMINKNNNDDDDSTSNIIPNDVIKSNHNFSLCDTGRFINNFDNIQLIDKGGFGVVFKAMHKIDGCYYAIKVIKFELNIDDKISKIKEVDEIKTMMKVEHKNIVRYITCWFEFEDSSLFGKRQRALSLDEQDYKKKSRKRLIEDTNSDLELVVNEDNDYFNSNSSDRKDLNLYDDDNDNNFDSYSFNDDDRKGSIVFEENDSSKEANDDEGMSMKNTKSKLRLNSKKKTYPLYFYMQMEYCEACPLSFFLQNRKSKTERNIITYLFHQITKAIFHIHSKGIIHRDLKPANIFLNSEYKIKIGDFGLASEKKVTNDKVGTFLYQSPEQLEEKNYNEKVDIYALGLILLEMCLIFNTESERRITLMNVRKGVIPEEMKEYPNEYVLVKKMTMEDEEKRPSIEEVMKSNEMEEMMKM